MEERRERKTSSSNQAHTQPFSQPSHQATDYRPKMIICGGSAYPRDWEYARLRAIADKVGALLMCDMAHTSGLVAASVVASPFEHCDVVTTTTHKSLRGPRAGMIFMRRGEKPADRLKRGEAPGTQHDYEDKIDFAVFPSLQGGPHNHQIAALAVALKSVATPEFASYALQVKKNAAALGARLVAHGYKIVTGGTDNHLVLWDLRPEDITGSKMEKACDLCHITLNKNAVVGDVSAMAPGGCRIGAPAMTSRGLKEADFEAIADLLHEVAVMCKDVQASSGKPLKAFTAGLEADKRVPALRAKVEAFAASYPMPGFKVGDAF